MQYTLEPGEDYLRVTCRGAPTIETFSVCLDAVVEHPEWHPGTHVLVDHTALEVSTVSIRDVSQYAEAFAIRRAAIGKGRWAILIPSVLLFGLARMWQSLTERRRDFEIGIFYTRDEAERWLLAGRA